MKNLSLLVLILVLATLSIFNFSCNSDNKYIEEKMTTILKSNIDNRFIVSDIKVKSINLLRDKSNIKEGFKVYEFSFESTIVLPSANMNYVVNIKDFKSISRLRSIYEYLPNLGTLSKIPKFSWHKNLRQISADSEIRIEGTNYYVVFGEEKIVNENPSDITLQINKVHETKNKIDIRQESISRVTMIEKQLAKRATER